MDTPRFGHSSFWPLDILGLTPYHRRDMQGNINNQPGFNYGGLPHLIEMDQQNQLLKALQAQQPQRIPYIGSAPIGMPPSR